MKIRLARDEDFAEMARLHRATIRNINSKDYPEDVIDAWAGRNKAQRLRDNAHLCKRWVALENSKIVGFCDHSFKCELLGLYVHKDYIGKGVGTKLYETAEKSLRKAGCKSVSITSTVTAKKFYQKKGFKVIKKDIYRFGGTECDVYKMRKAL